MTEREQQLKVWQGRLELARRFQDKHGNTNKRWDKNVKASAGDFNSQNELGDDAIDVNLIRSTMKTALPPLWLNEPFVSVRPTQRKFKGLDNVRAAELTELEGNYWLRELKVRHQVKKAVIAAESTNLGYVYVGYVKEKSDVEVKPKGTFGRFMARMSGDRTIQTENNPQVRFKQPFVKYWPTKNVLVPPGYDELEEAPWVSLVSYHPKMHVVSKYKIPDDKAMDLPTSDFSESISKAEVTSQFDDFLDSDDAKRVEVHNVWDKETRKVYTVVPGYEEFLETPKAWPFDVEGFPVICYRPEQIADEYHGTPPNSYVLPQNKEMNSTRTALRKRMNRTKSVIFMDASIAEEVADKYATAEDGEIIAIKTDDSDKPLSQRIIIDNGLPFDQGSVAYGQVIKSDLIEQSGLSAEQRGAGDPSVDSATASANIEKGAQVRGADRGDGVRMLYLEIFKKVWMILKQFPDVERSRMIAGPIAGQMAEVTYTLKELRGDFQFDLDFAAMMADNPATRATQAILKYNLMRTDPLVNPEQLILDVLKTQNTPNPEAYLLKLKDPEQEMALMMQGLPVEAHERDPHEEHLQKHEMQSDELNAIVQQLDRQGASDTDQRMKASLAQSLLIAHIQDHMRILMQIVGPQAGSRPGQPVAENMLRNQVAVRGGSETAAEMSGQPLNESTMVQ